jgi:hypothetical protein
MNKHSGTLVLGTIIAAGVFTMKAEATLVYTESTDFSNNLGSPTSIPGSLEPGLNTISGSLPDDFGEFADGDVFSVSNMNGYSVDSITVDISEFIGTTTDPDNSLGILRLEDPGFSQSAVWGNGQYALTVSETDADASEFLFRFGGPEDFENEEAGSMNYVVSMDVVPEPASVMLLGLSGGALWLYRRLMMM